MGWHGKYPSGDDSRQSIVGRIKRRKHAIRQCWVEIDILEDILNRKDRLTREKSKERPAIQSPA